MRAGSAGNTMKTPMRPRRLEAGWKVVAFRRLFAWLGLEIGRRQLGEGGGHALRFD